VADFSSPKLILLVAGSALLYSGIKGKSLSATARNLITGKSPALATSANVITSDPSVITDLANTPVAGNIRAGNPTANRAVGQLMAAQYGWSSGNEWACLNALWTRESGWDNTIANSSSGAYGIAQALPPTKYNKAGQPPSMGGAASAVSQIAWGLSYIKFRYGSPSVAWAHETANSWY
jgi:hypothetical protein